MKPKELRDLYLKATQNSSQFDEVAQTFRKNESEEPLYTAYNATIEAMKAQYEWIPFAKLGRLTTAMQLFKKAIENDKENPEIRLLRFAVQSKIPAFLGLNLDMTEDKRMIVANIEKLEKPLHPTLKAMLEFVITSGLCSSDEVVILRKAIEEPKK
jgi:tetratricopeptide (TPR) repeat protein